MANQTPPRSWKKRYSGKLAKTIKPASIGMPIQAAGTQKPRRTNGKIPQAHIELARLFQSRLRSAGNRPVENIKRAHGMARSRISVRSRLTRFQRLRCVAWISGHKCTRYPAFLRRTPSSISSMEGCEYLSLNPPSFTNTSRRIAPRPVQNVDASRWLC